MLKLGMLGSAGLLPLERVAGTQTTERLRDLPDLFEAKLPMPAVHKPVRRAPKMDYYRVTMQKANVEIIPGLQTLDLGLQRAVPRSDIPGEQRAPEEGAARKLQTAL